MLATGIKSPVGIKVNGSNIAQIEAVAEQIEQVVRGVPGVTSALAERLAGGRYIDIDIDRSKAAPYGVSVKELQSIVSVVVGGENIGETIEGRERYPSPHSQSKRNKTVGHYAACKCVKNTSFGER